MAHRGRRRTGGGDLCVGPGATAGRAASARLASSTAPTRPLDRCSLGMSRNGSARQPGPTTAMTNPSDVPAVEVAIELRQPLEDAARAAGLSPARIVNLALAEYLERRLRPDRETSGGTSSYVEMTAREELHDIF
jgi:hypothetical protein